MPNPPTEAPQIDPIDSAPPLPRTVVLLGWVSFFADVSGEMIYPLLPLFIVGVLGASATSLGWVEGVAAVIVSLLTAWAGIRSDRGRGGLHRRVPWIRWGYGLPVVGKAILTVAVGWPMVMLGRGVDRFGKGLRGSPRDALIADAAEPSQRGRAFGFHRMMDTAGATVGVLLAAVLLWWLGGSPEAQSASVEQAHDAGWAFRVIFGISAAMGLAALALTFLVRESPIDEGEQPATTDHGAPVRFFGLPRAYWMTAAVLLVFAVANSSDTFLLLRARDVGLAPWAVVLAYALYNILYAVISYPAGIVSDRLGRWRVVVFGWGIYAATYAGFAFTGAIGVWPLFALYGVYMALTDGVGKALIADHAPKDRRGAAIGIFYMLNGFATLVSSVVAGLLWDQVGHEWPFLVGAGAAVVAMVMLAVVSPSIRRAA